MTLRIDYGYTTVKRTVHVDNRTQMCVCVCVTSVTSVLVITANNKTSLNVLLHCRRRRRLNTFTRYETLITGAIVLLATIGD